MQPEELWKLRAGQRVTSPTGTVWRVYVVVKQLRAVLQRFIPANEHHVGLCLWTDLTPETCADWSAESAVEYQQHTQELLAFIKQKSA